MINPKYWIKDKKLISVQLSNNQEIQVDVTINIYTK